jgi:Zn-dependent protease with chaperone function
MTKQGVEIDTCSKCKGVWLDKGEIFFFTKKVIVVAKAIDKAIKESKPTQKLSPKTQQPMEEISLFDDRLHIDYCSHSGGLWFDGGEFEQLDKAKIKDLKITLDSQAKISAKPEEVFKFDKEVDYEVDRKKRVRMEMLARGLTPLPNLFIRSCGVLLGLYALLTFILITCVNFGYITPGIAILIGIGVISLQFIFGPWLMDLSLRWFYNMSWDAILPTHLSNFIRNTCQKQHMKFPRIGILFDGAPQAFTYGHHPNNARIVISQGLIDLLEPEEIQAVVAHEIGHAKHWDMLVMTIAYIVPLILYYIYRTLIEIRTSGRDRSAAPRYAIAIGSYILYIISQYIVLWLSRTREYYADRFAGEVTKNPNVLASALVKIAYGLAGQEKKRKGEKEVSRRPALEAVGALGIFDASTARSLAIASYSSPAHKMGGEIDKENLQGAMKWDLWNPWAKYYELHSTHPLIANRLNYLSEQSAYLGQEPFVVFNRKRPESYWDEFFVDLLILALPFLVVVCGMGIIVPTLALQGYELNLGMGFGWIILLFGIAELIKTFYSYKNPGYFPSMSIASLLKKVKVSAVRPVPCKLKGKIIGRGVPGLIWSEDFVMQDDTGIIFLDYRQPLGIWEFLFGLLRGARIQDQDVTLTGWYRRSPVPYVELKNFTVGTTTRTCYVYHIKLVFAGFIILLGIGMLLTSMLLTSLG